MSASGDGAQRVDVHSMWPHEAYDFTPWLAERLDLLGEELGLTLEEVGQEVAVGPYFLDILAKAPGEDGGDALVAIENQLEWSDLLHLGQLLTYATGLDARVAVWVAPEFRRQLAEALHRLNEWTRDEIGCYGVRVEVVRRDGSAELEPRLRKVVWPGGWDEDSTVPDGAQSEEGRLYDDFFKPLIAELVRTGFAAGTRQHSTVPGDSSPLGSGRVPATRRPSRDATPRRSRSTSARATSNKPTASSMNSTPPAKRSSRSSRNCLATGSGPTRMPALLNGTGAGTAHTRSPASASGATARSTIRPRNWRRSGAGCSATSPG